MVIMVDFLCNKMNTSHKKLFETMTWCEWHPKVVQLLSLWHEDSGAAPVSVTSNSGGAGFTETSNRDETARNTMNYQQWKEKKNQCHRCHFRPRNPHHDHIFVFHQCDQIKQCYHQTTNTHKNKPSEDADLAVNPPTKSSGHNPLFDSKYLWHI